MSTAETSRESSVLSYRNLSYSIKTKTGPKDLLHDVSVDVRAGELLAIMGPSGAGKSTLLDMMALRKHLNNDAEVLLNGHSVDAETMHKISSFVEQDDALLGVLTVRESITYALRLSLPLLPRKEVNDRVNLIIEALGLQSCEGQRIGTPIQRGISGGQKRRVTAACAIVTYPRILLLDEVTSGLDSTSAREVVGAIQQLAEAEGIIVIATIHQPSVEAFSLFSQVLLLAAGKTCYCGNPNDLDRFFEAWGHPIGRFTNPADHAMNYLNGDFGSSKSSSQAMRDFYLSEFEGFSLGPALHGYREGERRDLDDHNGGDYGKAGFLGTLFWNTLVLCERTATDYSRNLLAYGIRIGMYAGMGLMLATIWVRLGSADSTINDRLSVHFFSVAFLAFMSVAGIPIFLEERAVYYRESKNGLYTTLPFVLANTLVNIPFLFLSTVLFTVICYWAIGLHPGGAAFFRFLGFLFLSIFAAESQAIVVASLVPIFVAALAISAFINGFWMSVGGYFIKARTLPRFWYYSFHYMDYQKYAFELLTNSDLRGINFNCDNLVNGNCVCAYPSSTPQTCTVSGEDVLQYFDIDNISYGQWASIIISITIIYRVALYASLKLRSS